MNNQLRIVSGVLMLAMAGQSLAATSWNTNSYNPGSITVGTTTATPTAWAGVNNGTLVQQTGDTNVTSSTNDLNTTSHFGSYSGGGLGINNTIDPESYGSAPAHAIDNAGAREMVLLTFGSAVNLTSLSMGYFSGDADFTVMAFNVSGALTGSAANPSLGTGGKTWNSLGAANSGWKLIGDYQNSTTGTKTFANSYYSSYWLVGAYNPLVGVMAGFTADTNSDYFKLSSVSGNVCAGTVTGGKCVPSSNVPEPGSLALLGLGLMGMIRMRKVRKV